MTFLERLIQHAKGRKVFLIADGHPVHKAKAVKVWLEQRPKEIELFYLPAYSPARNPDELLNHISQSARSGKLEECLKKTQAKAA